MSGWFFFDQHNIPHLDNCLYMDLKQKRCGDNLYLDYISRLLILSQTLMSYTLQAD